jgi:hypothetical protein
MIGIIQMKWMVNVLIVGVQQLMEKQHKAAIILPLVVKRVVMLLVMAVVDM